MIIGRKNYPNIGHIRAKQLSHKERRWQLSVYPPTPGPLQGHEPAHHVEVEVSQEEAERIERAAPHLLSSGIAQPSHADRARLGLWSGRPKRKANGGSDAP